MNFTFKKKRIGKTSTFGSIAPLLLKELKLEEAYLMANLRDQWPSIVGELIGTHSLPERIYKHTLFVIADHPVYANEIAMMKSSILNRIKEANCMMGLKNMKVEIKKIKWIGAE